MFRLLSFCTLLLLFSNGIQADEVWVSIKYADINQTGASSSIAAIDEEDLKIIVNGATSFGLIKLSKLTAVSANGQISKFQDTPVFGRKYFNGDMYIRFDSILNVTELHPSFVQELNELHN